jgi:enoyl-CoA hydratase
MWHRPRGTINHVTTDVLAKVTDGVATVTLSRPERRNAISSQLLAALTSALTGLDERRDVHAIVLTGADPAFCAGLDLRELEQPGSALSVSPPAGRPVPELGKPLIGAVNGAAVTGGLELALRCDFLVASERACFADTHARIGIQPGWGLTVLLPEAIGLRRAREMSATGNFVDARTALAWGLVNHVVPHEELLGFARRLAADIASNDVDAVRAIYATYRQGALVTGAQALALEARAHAEWRGGGIDPAEVARRRAGVIERGRAQA